MFIHKTHMYAFASTHTQSYNNINVNIQTYPHKIIYKDQQIKCISAYL